MRAVLLILLALLWAPLAVAEREVGGVEWPQHVEAQDGSELTFNGAALRTRFLVRVYSGALYVAATSADPAVLRDPQRPARMVIHFLRDGIRADQVNDAWRDGITANHDEATVEALAGALDELLALTPEEVDDGDVLAYEHVPGEGTTVSLNGEPRGRVDRDELFAALLATWIGDDPPSGGFRDAILGR